MPLLFSFTYLHAATFTNTYDPLNRLTNAAYSDGSRESYSYDKSGNRTVRITSAATIKLDSTPPSVPTNLVSLTYTPSQLSVGWSRSFDMGGSGLAGYSVFVNGVLATNTTDTTFTLSNYFPGLNYCITVIAADRYTNTSLPSVPLCYATQATNDLLSPLLTITSPANNAVLHTNRTPISGTVTDASRGNNGIASLTINAASVAGGSATLNATSYWSAVYSLRPGWNAFEIVARDASIAQNSSTSRLDLLSVPSTNEPPAFASFGPGTQGGVAMQLVSETNLTVEIWASTNLKDWEFLTNVYFTNWLADWTDPAFASYSQRFYRLLRRSIWPPTLRLKQANHIPSRMPVALGDNGWFYGMRSNGVYAFDSQTLEPKWFFQFGSSCPVIASNAVSLAPGGGPVFFQNDFYSSDCTNGLIALDPTNGAFLWRRTNGGLYARQVPSVNEVGSRVYFGSDPLSGLNYSTMAPFTFSISNSHVGSIGGQGLALDAQNNIYVGGHGPSSVVSSFGSSGAYRWSRTNVGSDHLRIVAIPNSTTILLCSTNLLFAWNSATGTDKWQAWSLEDPVTDEAGNIIAYSHYGQYISNTFYGETVSLTPNGVPRWTNLVGNYKPAVDFVDSAKRVFVHADRTLFALSTETGEVLWSFTADAKIVTPATLASGGNIYFVDQLNNAYLLEANLDYARSTWPIAIYGNRRHTGKSAVFLVQPPRR